MDSCGWFWVPADGFWWCRWFSEICSFSSCGEIRCFKYKRSRQLWGVFVVSTNNDAKVRSKQMTKFLSNSTYKVSLEKTFGGERSFFYESWHIYLYVNSPRFDSVSPHCGAIFSRISSFGLLLVGRSVF